MNKDDSTLLNTQVKRHKIHPTISTDDKMAGGINDESKLQRSKFRVARAIFLWLTPCRWRVSCATAYPDRRRVRIQWSWPLTSKIGCLISRINGGKKKKNEETGSCVKWRERKAKGGDLKDKALSWGDGRKRARKGKRTEVNEQGTRRGQPEESRQVGIFSLFFLVHGAINKFNSSGN